MGVGARGGEFGVHVGEFGLDELVVSDGGGKLGAGVGVGEDEGEGGLHEAGGEGLVGGALLEGKGGMWWDREVNVP